MEPESYQNEAAVQGSLKESSGIIPRDPRGDAASTVSCREFPAGAGPVDLEGVGSDGSTIPRNPIRSAPPSTTTLLGVIGRRIERRNRVIRRLSVDVTAKLEFRGPMPTHRSGVRPEAAESAGESWRAFISRVYQSSLVSLQCRCGAWLC